MSILENRPTEVSCSNPVAVYKFTTSLLPSLTFQQNVKRDAGNVMERGSVFPTIRSQVRKPVSTIGRYSVFSMFEHRDWKSLPQEN